MISINLYDADIELVELSLALLRESTHKADRPRARRIADLEARLQKRIKVGIENGDVSP